MAGFELESLESAAPAFTGVVVAEILSAEPHPQADKLQVCRVTHRRRGHALQIVCGAPNARAGLKSALAQVGATLPGEVAHQGGEDCAASSRRACSRSAKELGLGESASGILELPRRCAGRHAAARVPGAR